MTAQPDVADLRVVAVTYFSGDELDGFLDSLATATKRSTHVVLADNGSPDGSLDRFAGRPGVEVLHTGANLGYGGAANVGAKGCAGDWIVVANPDIRWHEGSIDTLLDAAERWPRAGALGPAILTPQGDLYPSARALPSLSRGIGHALCGWWWPTNPWTAAYRRERGTPEEGPAGWLSGSCLLLRATAFDDVGGFDPAYFMYFEDLDLGRRLARAGWLNVYVPTSVVEHAGGHSTSRESAAMLRAHHRSAYRYLASEYDGLRWAPVRWLLGFGLAARYLLSRLSTRVGEGARPTRRGSVLDEGETR